MPIKTALVNTTKTTLGPVTLLQYLHGKGFGVDYYHAPENANNLYSQHDLQVLASSLRNYSLVGLSSFTISEARTFQLTKAIKEISPATHVILGGPNVIMDPERILMDSAADSVCIHEGEIPMTELILRLGSSAPVEDIAGLWFKKGDALVRNPYASPLENLDEIPFENYKLSRHGSYFRLAQGRFVSETSLAEGIENPCMFNSCVYMMTTRGCPYDCSYCINSTLNRIGEEQGFTRIRRMSNEAIIAGLQDALSGDPSIENVFFFDDDFSLRSESELENFASLYKERIGVPFHIFANPNTTSNKKLDFYADAGLASVEFGVQTVSARVLQIYNRQQNAAHMKRILEHVRENRLNIQVSFDIITNSPFECPQDIAENIEYVLSLPGNFELYVHNLHLFPGSELWKINGGGTGNENHEYQDNFSSSGTVFYNELHSKLLFAMQGVHREEEPDRFGCLTRSEIREILHSTIQDSAAWIQLLDERMATTRVATYYRGLRKE
ncbi:MAG: radical SAM protein [Deltaproteobacteria bacterium]|nr:radical SAM protein [Deltaproteobacteria bacterium]